MEKIGDADARRIVGGPKSDDLSGDAGLKSGDVTGWICQNLRNEKKYDALKKELESAFEQAAVGKGKERHSHGERFEDQQICQLTRWLKDNLVAGPLFQACKKILETSRLSRTEALHELDGAMVYIAAAKVVLREGSTPS